MSLPITNRQKEMLSILYHYIKETGYPPTFIEMRERLGIKSNQSVVDLLYKLEEKKLIKRNQSGARSIAILPLGYQLLEEEPLVPFLGMTHACAPINVIDLYDEWQSLSENLSKFNHNVYLLKIAGDSMINAGIDDGDIVLVTEVKEFSSDDIVVANIDGELNVKRFVVQEKPPFMYLKTENPEHSIDLFTNKVELKGKVLYVIKKKRMNIIS